MATLDDVRRIAAELPGSEERTSAGGVTWFVRSKPYVWECHPWPSIPDKVREIIGNELVLGVKIADAIEARALRHMDAHTFLPQTTKWSEPKIAFRMAGIDAEHLRELVIEAWRVQAPRYLRREYDEAHPAAEDAMPLP